MFAGQQVVNNKGQIVSQKKFNKALLALMNDKFAGGMKKQAQTLKWRLVYCHRCHKVGPCQCDGNDQRRNRKSRLCTGYL